MAYPFGHPLNLSVHGTPTSNLLIRNCSKKHLFAWKRSIAKHAASRGHPLREFRNKRGIVTCMFHNEHIGLQWTPEMAKSTSLCNRLPKRFMSTGIDALLHTPRVSRPIRKLLVANRGEISIRIQRACKELGIKTISVYSREDDRSLHRIISDESYVLGESEGNRATTPVSAYLNQQEIVDLALRHEADAIHPGYGFLSENGEFAALVEANNIMFVGPSSKAVLLMGDKITARQLAVEAGLPIIPGNFLPMNNAAAALETCKTIGFPVMLKAAYGGGGRGMRRVWKEEDFNEAFERAASEAQNAFGNGQLFAEKLIFGGQHIEVQVMGDLYGNIVHFLERDCSIQRRHQKVIEVAPAPFLKDSVRLKILEDAMKLVHYVKYQNAGTVEFLVEGDQHYFIEVNARLQVEHTVTEEVVGVDLVKTQLAISSGQSLPELGIFQEVINKAVHGGAGNRGPVSVQCRVTTEDSLQNFRPSTGRIDLYQPAAGPGIRLDGAIGASGAVISPHFDSLLVKVISSGKDFTEAIARATRALNETRIRGVTTNIPFIKNVLTHPKFLSGDANVQFIDEHPELLNYDLLDISSQNICKYLAEVIVNGPLTQLVNSNAALVREPATLPSIKEKIHTSTFGGGSWAGPPEHLQFGTKQATPFENGYKQLLEELGPSGFAREIRKKKALLLTDTSLRDAHQSLFATRLRTHDILKIAPYYARAFPNLFSLENWGGATYDVAYRFLRECPWKRLELLREAIPNIPFQMLFRGANGVGYTAYADNILYKFCSEAVEYGMDIFRIFDSVNYLDNLKVGIQSVGAAGGVVEATISYTGDVSNPNRKPYTLDYYLDLARRLQAEDIHILGIKDMAGVLTPGAARLLVGTLRKEFPDLPIHVHTHDTAGLGVASMLAAAKAGADIVDVCMDSLSGLTSQPSIGAVAVSLKGTAIDPNMDLASISGFSEYFEHVRRYYASFDCTDTLKSGSSDVYEHQIPGGQYTNLHMQAFSLGMADQWRDIKEAYKEANYLLGDPPKVTPSSKVVGDMAQFMVQNKLNGVSVLQKADDLSFPTSVIEYFQGYIGQPPFGFPEPLRSQILKGAPIVEGRPGSSLPAADWEATRRYLETKFQRKFKDIELLSYLIYPQVFEDFLEFTKAYGDISSLPTPNYFTGAMPGESISVNMSGREVDIKYIAKTHVLSDGSRDVFFEVMGLPRTVNVKDKNSAQENNINVKADPKDPKQIGAPMPGTIISYKVKENEKVQKGEPLVILSAMKMEMIVVAPMNGTVASIPLKDGGSVLVNDLLVKLQ